MAEHEALDAASKDTSAKTRRRDKAAELTAAASEPMDLQRLPDADAHTPTGRQRTGDPPKARKQE